MNKLLKKLEEIINTPYFENQDFEEFDRKLTRIMRIVVRACLLIYFPVVFLAVALRFVIEPEYWIYIDMAMIAAAIILPTLYIRSRLRCQAE